MRKKKQQQRYFNYVKIIVKSSGKHEREKSGQFVAIGNIKGYVRNRKKMELPYSKGCVVKWENMHI